PRRRFLSGVEDVHADELLVLIGKKLGAKIRLRGQEPLHVVGLSVVLEVLSDARVFGEEASPIVEAPLVQVRTRSDGLTRARAQVRPRRGRAIPRGAAAEVLMTRGGGVKVDGHLQN